MNKREFIKTSLKGLGGLAIGAESLPLFGANEKINMNNKELWKWSKEAYWYTTTPRGPKCTLCPNNCTIKPDELGDCRTRINKNGKIYTIAYGNPCAVHIDPVEKKPLSHYMPGSMTLSVATAGCNLACLNCQNPNISQVSPYDTQNADLMPEKLVKAAVDRNMKSLSYTYTEPIVYYEYTFDTAKLAHEAGLKNIIVSAGYIHKKPMRKLAKYIDAANIDLKSFDNSIYESLNAAELQPVLDSLKILKEEGAWLEITNLIIPGYTDDLDMIKRMCHWLAENGFSHYPLHFSRFHPAHKLMTIAPTPLNTMEKAKEIANNEGMKYIYIGNVPNTQWNDTYCPSCNKKLIDRTGYLLQEMHIVNACCEYCGEPIHGVW
jgi:pyruvate formate lyase activating enzyme